MTKITREQHNQIIKETHELKSLLIQSIIQRVDKCRKKALLNDKYYDF